MALALLFAILVVALPAHAFVHDVPLGSHAQICVACSAILSSSECAAACACGWCKNGNNETSARCIDIDASQIDARPKTCGVGGAWHTDALQTRCDLYSARTVYGLAAALIVTLSTIVLFAVFKCVLAVRKRAERRARQIGNDDYM